MRVLAIDPGSEKSGWVLFEDGVPTAWGWDENADVSEFIQNDREHGPGVTVIEDVGHYGLAVGRDVFETVKWMGRFDPYQRCVFIPRPTIKTHLCGVSIARDANVRQALIDRFGGQAKAIGGAKCRNCHGVGLRGRGKARGGCPACHCREFVATGLNDDTVVAFVSGNVSTRPRIGEKGCGYQSHPGPLHGLSGHCWSALAVGLTYLETKEHPDD